MLIGHDGQIEVKSFEGQGGPRKCATFSLATTERYKDRNGNLVNNTEWHNIVSWNHAELCEKYVSKGSQLYIEGRIRGREWEKDGVKHFGVEIVADEMTLLGRRQDNPAQPQQPYQQPAQSYQQPAQSYQQPAQSVNTQPAVPAQDPDDLPF